ncbi:MAG: hypothetical protein LBQ31_09350 [Bacteroidales bacterium]|jgi:hypothetical protein|nr:hypothetical protein [Bacteroidales bacterium]
MKTLLFTLSVLLTSFLMAKPPSGELEINKEDCTCNGKKLYGKVKVTEMSDAADFYIRETNVGQDIEVKVVNYSPEKCGEWQFTDSYSDADFIVAYTNVGPNFEIKFSNFPGVK